jgi:hypothetical protein
VADFAVIEDGFDGVTRLNDAKCDAVSNNFVSRDYIIVLIGLKSLFRVEGYGLEAWQSSRTEKLWDR